MSDLLLEIIVYLLLAGIIGFVVGWVVRGGGKNEIANTSEASQKKESSTVETALKTITNEKKREQTPPTNIVLLKEAREEGADKLSLIKGIGSVLEKKLNQLGIYHFDQIISWNAEEQAWIGVQILFPKKVEREDWVKQAKKLSA